MEPNFMRFGLFLIIVTVFLSGCDMRVEVEMGEKTSGKQKNVDVHCTPVIIYSDSRGYDIVMNESAEEAIVSIRDYVAEKRDGVQTAWVPRWLAKGEKVKAVRGNDRIFFLEKSFKPILRRVTSKRSSGHSRAGRVWELYADKPDLVTHYCYGSANLTGDFFRYLYRENRGMPFSNLDSIDWSKIEISTEK